MSNAEPKMARAVRSPLLSGVVVAVLFAALPTSATEPRYVVPGDETTIIDWATGLEWQRSAEASLSWKEALAYCVDLELDGHDDWQLPNVLELASIIDDTTSPAINLWLRPDISLSANGVWTSTTSPTLFSTAYVVHFADFSDIYVEQSTYANGGIATLAKTEPADVMCVRTR